MALRFIASRYDEVSNKTKIYAEDITEDTQNNFQVLATGNVTEKTEDEQLEIVKNLNFARYYADKATDEFVSLIEEKTKVFDSLVSKTGEVLQQLEEQRKLSETSNSSVSQLILLLLNSGFLLIDEQDKIELNPVISKLLEESDKE